MNSTKIIIPVIHQIFPEASLKEAAKAFKAGADGVLLISHDRRDDELIEPAMALRGRFPDKLIGINMLGVSAECALSIALESGLNAVWTDRPGVDSAVISEMAVRISNTLARVGPDFHFFGSVAFKGQPVDHQPGRAAAAASVLRMIPTTSGTGTGVAAPVEKIAAMRDGIGNEATLAIASGLTPENVGYYLRYATHFLVSTGVSKDFHHFDEVRLARFVERVRDFSSAMAA